MLLAKIEARNPDKRLIHVIWDNAAYYKGPDVREFLGRPVPHPSDPTAALLSAPEPDRAIMGRHAPVHDPQSPLPNAKAVHHRDPQVLPRDRHERVKIIPQQSVRQLQGHNQPRISSFAVVTV